MNYLQLDMHRFETLAFESSVTLKSG